MVSSDSQDSTESDGIKPSFGIGASGQSNLSELTIDYSPFEKECIHDRRLVIFPVLPWQERRIWGTYYCTKCPWEELYKHDF